MAAAFLRVNGITLKFDDIEAYAFMIGLYESDSFRFDHLDVWLRQHAHPV